MKEVKKNQTNEPAVAIRQNLNIEIFQPWTGGSFSFSSS